MKFKLTAIGLAMVTMGSAHAGITVTGSSSSQAPYVLPVDPFLDVTSVLTAGDAVQKAGAAVGTTYRMAGLADGLGALDNGDGTMTVLMNHEIGSTQGALHDHGAIGSFVSKWIINKSSFSVVSGEDLIKQVYGWNTGTQSSNTTTSALSFNRFCSADLPDVSAFYNASTGLGSTARIFMHGEEGGANGWQQATVVTGADAGKSYVLGKFNLSTNGSGLTGVGGWENALANPLAQDKTIVIGNNDGGTGIMSNALAVYVGTKQATGSEIDKAGLTNGVLKFINVTGNAAEIPAANATTRNTAITNGTRFSLSGTASTTFSRPEDGAWNPNNPKEYFFVTTDRLDNQDTVGGTQKGATRLWRLTFDDITNPDAGGKIDLMIDTGDTTKFPRGLGATNVPNMFDNMSINKDGTITLQEDTGNAQHNAKVWQFNPATGELLLIAKFDPANFGDLAPGTGAFTAGTHTQDEESSGVIDITDVLAKNDGRRYLMLVAQDHDSAANLIAKGYMNAGATASEMVEGGQLLIFASPVPEPQTYALVGGGIVLLGAFARRAKRAND